MRKAFTILAKEKNNQRGFIQIPLSINIIIIILIFALGTGIGIILHKERQKPEREILIPQIESSEKTENTKEEGDDKGKTESSALKVEKCKAEAEIKAEKFLEDLIDSYRKKCKQNNEATPTQGIPYGVSCYFPSEKERSEIKEKNYNQFYLDCLGQL